VTIAPLDPPAPLTTARLTLRPFEMSDLDAYHDLLGREDVCRFLIWEPMNRDEARAKLELRIRQTRIKSEGDAILLAVVETATGRMIGELMLRLASSLSRQGEVGWSIHPDVQGRGLATEGATELLRLGFDQLGLHRIHAGADSRNTGSIRVMEKLGMRREALFVEAELFKGEWAGDVIYAILEDEWRERSSR
jgi:RimJ/RimL family protein N-acetyltransferase